MTDKKKGIDRKTFENHPSIPHTIRTIITHACPRCSSTNLVKNGRDYKWGQKFCCNDCGPYGTLQQPSPDPALISDYVERAVRERLSLRGIERVFRISRRTVIGQSRLK